MPGEITDEALLEASRGGDRGALEHLLVRYQPRVYRFGLRMCRDREEASDVLQETLIAAVGGLASSTLISLFLEPVMFLFFARRPEDVSGSAGHPRRDGSVADG